jgi:hypothetical protein
MLLKFLVGTWHPRVAFEMAVILLFALDEAAR